MILALVRHGQTDYNKVLRIQGLTDNPLNDIGRGQADNTARYLVNNDSNWDYIFSSPLIRARETAEIIAGKLSLEVSRLLPGFVERSFGPFEGTYIKDIYPDVVMDDFRKEGFEHNKAMIDRIVNETFKLHKEYEGKKVLLVAHAHVIKALCIYFDSQKYDWIENYVSNSSVFYFKVSKDNIELIKDISF